MKAVVVDRFGGQPYIADIPVPEPAENEVRVRIYAAGLNPLDWRIADGMLQNSLPHHFPLVLGLDGMGVIDAVGKQVSRFQPGDRVVGRFLSNEAGRGCFCEYQTLSQDGMLVTVPASQFLPELTMLPTAGVSALQIAEYMNVPAGSRIAVIGAAGGVGSFVTRILSQRGYKVIAVAGKQQTRYLKKIGAYDVIDYRNGDVLAQLYDRYPGEGAGIVDLVSGPDAFMRNLLWIADGGMALSTVHAASSENAHLVSVVNFEFSPDIAALQDMVNMQFRGETDGIRWSEITPEDIPACLQKSRKGHGTGKMIARFI
ncbi:NADP-dependent oxidoreductase [Morganella morganii]|uniref:NADP-dependent oxidoreductase n=1 Tax=Morganella morganii TaxID=582 RepID=UPI003F282CEA